MSKCKLDACTRTDTDQYGSGYCVAHFRLDGATTDQIRAANNLIRLQRVETQRAERDSIRSRVKARANPGPPATGDSAGLDDLAKLVKLAKSDSDKAKCIKLAKKLLAKGAKNAMSMIPKTWL